MSETPSDIDLLIVYDQEVVTPLRAYDLRPQFAATLGTLTSLRPHIQLLNTAEASETDFAASERGVLLYQRD